MKNKLNPLLLFGFGLILMYCNRKEIERPFAQLETTEVTNINEEGVTVKAKVLFLPKSDPIVDHGFIYGKVPGSNVYPEYTFDDYSISLGDQLSGDEFSALINTGLIKGESYFIRAFLKSTEWEAYGTPVFFTSQGSGGIELTEIIPSDTIVPGETLTIKGVNLGTDRRLLSVKIGAVEVPFFNVNDTILTFQVPRNVRDNEVIQISSDFNNQSFSFSMPHIPAPVLNSISPSKIADGDTITLKGKYFSSELGWNKIIFFINADFTLLSSDRDQIQFLLNSSWPPPSNSRNIWVEVGQRTSNGITFDYRDMIIDDFFPKEGKEGDTLTIVGKNFFKRPHIIFVGMEDFNEGWPVLKSSTDTIITLVGRYPINPSETKPMRKIRVATNGSNVLTEEKFTYIR